MAKQEYPKWRYGPNGQRVLLRNEAELQALGPGWYDSPAKVPTGKAGIPEQQKPATGAVDTNPVPAGDTVSSRKKRGRPPKVSRDDG